MIDRISEIHTLVDYYYKSRKGENKETVAISMTPRLMDDTLKEVMDPASVLNKAHLSNKSHRMTAFIALGLEYAEILKEQNKTS